MGEIVAQEGKGPAVIGRAIGVRCRAGLIGIAKLIQFLAGRACVRHFPHGIPSQILLDAEVPVLHVRISDAGAINNLGVIYMQMQKPQEALAAFQYGIKVAPDDETLYLNLARVYVRLGDRAKARDILQQLLEHKPDSSAAREALEALRRL